MSNFDENKRAGLRRFFIDQIDQSFFQGMNANFLIQFKKVKKSSYFPGTISNARKSG